MSDYLYTSAGNMAGMWITTTGSTTYTLPVATHPATISLPAPEPGPLDWLDAEIEATCRLARAA